jgi:hypothetical protein
MRRLGNKGNIRGNERRRLVDPRAIRHDQAGFDGSARLGPAHEYATFDEKEIDTALNILGGRVLTRSGVRFGIDHGPSFGRLRQLSWPGRGQGIERRRER